MLVDTYISDCFECSLNDSTDLSNIAKTPDGNGSLSRACGIPAISGGEEVSGYIGAGEATGLG